MTTLKQLLDKLPPWTLTIVCFLAICWLTLAPHPLPDNDIPLFPGADKIVHAIMFGGFALCIILDWHRRHGWPVKGNKHDIIAACLASAFGLVTEILQNEMQAGRSGDGWDLVADIAGAFIVAAGVAFYKHRLQRDDPD
ncbi:MAG: VanZ family protein [Muribaculaceae bacterium]|nr:VanZ family protein [Muribaculaceae bacterium]